MISVKLFSNIIKLLVNQNLNAIQVQPEKISQFSVKTEPKYTNCSIIIILSNLDLYSIG